MVSGEVTTETYPFFSRHAYYRSQEIILVIIFYMNLSINNTSGAVCIVFSRQNGFMQTLTMIYDALILHVYGHIRNAKLHRQYSIILRFFMMFSNGEIISA
ncbi:hypothetical protein EPI10_027273 [Gossypium australe]|uniref:Uncharacterized protein n=1 Tax=Gossypium australe TaxID=47621 RepID=A0A5B6UZJ4_9ROSI|nr:hypothetical protein EPI10_027273 [Gossypium australe]